MSVQSFIAGSLACTKRSLRTHSLRPFVFPDLTTGSASWDLAHLLFSPCFLLAPRQDKQVSRGTEKTSHQSRSISECCGKGCKDPSVMKLPSSAIKPGWLRAGRPLQVAVNLNLSAAQAQQRRLWFPCSHYMRSSSPVCWQCLGNSAQRWHGCRPSAYATVERRLYTVRTWRRDLPWSQWPPQPVLSKMAIPAHLWDRKSGRCYQAAVFHLVSPTMIPMTDAFLNHVCCGVRSAKGNRVSLWFPRLWSSGHLQYVQTSQEATLLIHPQSWGCKDVSEPWV